MMKVRYADVCRIAGTTLDEPAIWAGTDTPPAHAPITIPWALGICCAAAVRRDNPTSVVGYLRQIMAAWGKVTEGWLADRFAEGKTHFALVHADRPVLQAPQLYWPDVEAIYHALRAVAGEEERGS